MLAFISKPSSQLVVALIHFAMICFVPNTIVHMIAGISLFIGGLNIGYSMARGELYESNNDDMSGM